MSAITISQFQVPNFRALIQKEDGTLFNPTTDLATAEELAQEQITKAPLSYTVYKATSSNGAFAYDTEEAQPVSGYENVAIDSSALLSSAPDGYNFTFTPANRKTFAFATNGEYFVDFLLYPKVGAAISWRTGVKVG